mgnify:CR=1 FL=1
MPSLLFSTFVMSIGSWSTVVIAESDLHAISFVRFGPRGCEKENKGKDLLFDTVCRAVDG